MVMEKKPVAIKVNLSVPKYWINLYYILMERKQTWKEKRIIKSRDTCTMYTCKLITMDLNTVID